MRKLLTFAATFAATAGLALSASAALIDFEAAGDADERGLTNPVDAGIENLFIDGFSLNIRSGVFGGGQAYNPYLDASSGGLPGGLGVCRELEAGPGSECADSGDDSVDGDVVGSEEAFIINFLDGPFNITSLSFRDGAHNLINDSDGLVELFVNGAMSVLSFAEVVALAAGGGLNNTESLGFGYVDTEFYLSSIGLNEVPIPGALPLLLSGLAGLGFASRKKKAKA